MEFHHPDYYEKNLTLLQQYHPQVWELLTTARPQPMGELCRSRGGKPNLRLALKNGETVLLHNADDPEAEVRDFLKMVPEDSTGFVTLMGMGLGYTPLGLLQNRPDIRHLVVFDLEPGIFQQALHVNDLSPILADPRLVLNIGPGPDVDAIMAPLARALQLESIHSLSHLPSFKFNEEGYQGLSEKVFACVNEYNVGAATVFAFGRSFLANRFGHLTSMHHHYLLEGLQGAFADIPAILVAGGPSLDKNIHLLAEAKNKAVIIAVDTVLPALLSRGIAPDFVTSIDPEEFTFEKYAEVIPQIEKTALICTAWVTPKVPKTFPNGRVFWTFAGNGVESWMNSLMGGRLLTTGAKTVAHLSFTAAVILGCSPIVFVGQDLAFSGEKDHASETVLSNQDMLDDLFKSGKDLIWVEGNLQEKVATNRSFYSMIKSFEKMIAGTPGRYINATEGGARLAGTEIRTLREVMDAHCGRAYDIEERIDAFFSRTPRMASEVLLREFREVKKQIRNQHGYIRKSDKISRQLRSRIAALRKNGLAYRSASALPKPVQKMLNEIDGFHQKMDKAYGLWHVLEEITLEGLRHSERLRHSIELLKNKPERYLDWIEKNLDRLDIINRVRREVLGEFETHLERTLDYHAEESELKQQLRVKETGIDEYLNLMRLYDECGQITMLDQVLAEVGQANQDSPEIQYYQGCVAAHRFEQARAEVHFNSAIRLDPDFSQRVSAFGHQMAEQYYRYTLRLKMDGYDIRKMLLRGARYCSTHKELNLEMNELVTKDLTAVGAALEAGEFEKAGSRIAPWVRELAENPKLSECLRPAPMGELLRHQGQLLIQKSEFMAAAECFQRAMEYLPHATDLYIHQCDALFAGESFDAGIACLQKAVARDRNYAIYWENIGDHLQAVQQFGDAILAYEQCFIVLPDKIDLLKKIGDCYMALEQPSAGREAYIQYTLKSGRVPALNIG